MSSEGKEGRILGLLVKLRKAEAEILALKAGVMRLKYQKKVLEEELWKMRQEAQA